MFQKIENYLILKNSENFEEHIAKIIELEKESRKIKRFKRRIFELWE